MLNTRVLLKLIYISFFIILSSCSEKQINKPVKIMFLVEPEIEIFDDYKIILSGNTYTELINSGVIPELVLKRIRLDNITESFKTGPYALEFENETESLQQFINNIKSEFSENSNIINVNITFENPELSEKVSDVLKEIVYNYSVYLIRNNINKKINNIEYQKKLLLEKIPNINNSEDKNKLENYNEFVSEFLQIEKELNELIAEKNNVVKKLELIEMNTKKISETDLKKINDLKSELENYKIEFNKIVKTHKPLHPTYKKLNDKIKTINTKLNQLDNIDDNSKLINQYKNQIKELDFKIVDLKKQYNKYIEILNTDDIDTIKYQIQNIQKKYFQLVNQIEILKNSIPEKFVNIKVIKK
jgi:DNA repair exonuclease SbcCD ATPase subunit